MKEREKERKKVSDIHKYNTRSARACLFFSTQDHRSIGYRIPKEWESLPKELKETVSLGGLKRKSKDRFIKGYEAFKCIKLDCAVCLDMSRNAVQLE